MRAAARRERRAPAWNFAALLLCAALLAGCGSGAAPASSAVPGATASASAPASPSRASDSRGRTVAGGGAASARRDVGFRSRALFEEHFRKHGREFGQVTPAQYLRIAQDLRDRPAGGDVLEFVRGDGVVTRFDRGSGTFLAFNTNGVIRTCFRPRDGERYFRRQALR